MQDACFWKTDLYMQIGGINPEIRYAADYDLFLRMAMQGQCIYTPHVFSAFRRHEGQTSERYRVAYKKEKAASANLANAVISKIPIPMWSKAYYWLYPKFRARIAARNVKAIKGVNLGRLVREFQAGLSSSY